MSIKEFNYLNEKWMNATDEAVKNHEAGEFAKAKPLYEQALFYSEVMFRAIAEAEKLNVKVVANFSISCVNVAHNYFALGDTAKAGQYLFYNVWHLKMLSRQNVISDLLRTEVIHTWHDAVMIFYDFYNRIKDDPKVDLWTEETYDQIKETKDWLAEHKAKLN